MSGGPLFPRLPGLDFFANDDLDDYLTLPLARMNDTPLHRTNREGRTGIQRPPPTAPRALRRQLANLHGRRAHPRHHQRPDERYIAAFARAFGEEPPIRRHGYHGPGPNPNEQRLLAELIELAAERLAYFSPNDINEGSQRFRIARRARHPDLPSPGLADLFHEEPDAIEDLGAFAPIYGLRPQGRDYGVQREEYVRRIAEGDDGENEVGDVNDLIAGRVGGWGNHYHPGQPGVRMQFTSHMDLADDGEGPLNAANGERVDRDRRPQVNIGFPHEHLNGAAQLGAQMPGVLGIEPQGQRRRGRAVKEELPQYQEAVLSERQGSGGESRSGRRRIGRSRSSDRVE